MMKDFNEQAVAELTLCTQNNWADMHHLRVIPTINTLAKHMSRGEWNESLALRSMRRLADEGAKRYVNDFCEAGTRYGRMFTPSDRKEVAKRLLEEYLNLIIEKSNVNQAA